jgi:hypothetical protein
MIELHARQQRVDSCPLDGLIGSRQGGELLDRRPIGGNG